MPKRGKKYLEVIQKVDRDRYYTPQEAVKLVKEVSYTSFDGTVELHLRMGLDPRRSEQQIRGVVRLPYGLGKTVRVLVFAAGADAQIARDAGADYIMADDEDIQKIMDGWVDFDIAIAVPDMMRKVGRLGRVLGRRGLMPTPKTGTVVQPEDLPRVIDEAKAGRVEYRLDRTANIHCPIGKVSFTDEQLLGNLAAIMDAIRRAKPAAAKGTYVKRVTLAPSMGPGVRVDAAQALALEATK
ncbi:MAG TPA: 50S ribosomal protein L1 [Anaerolineae bacterium]|nr:50S ribosomal protein L1 [Anaerolineae bacterium]HQK12445.1 50S ribosomal protein L1 [Anaerolineae bacterium]